MTSEHHRRVLIVDDDPDIRNLLVAVLRRKSLVADVATNGDEAIDLLRQHAYGVVLLDLFMPVTDGFAVLDAIEREAWQPVVLVISGADRSTLEKLNTPLDSRHREKTLRSRGARRRRRVLRRHPRPARLRDHGPRDDVGTVPGVFVEDVGPRLRSHAVTRQR